MSDARFTDFPALPPALPGTHFVLDDPRAGRLAWYYDAPAAAESGVPLLLLHSINATASAYEVRPIYEHYARARPTYAIDLPGFGLSDRGARRYTPRLMTDAVRAAAAEVLRRHGGVPVDALALSLSCEFLARAANEDAGAFRSLALVSPTGFTGAKRSDGPPGTTRAIPGLHAALAWAPLDDALFWLLSRPRVIRYFLRRTWGRREIDEGAWAYAVRAARAPGAKHAPLYFLSAHLFSADVSRLYDGLGQPVWMSHGVRGDFVDYQGAEAMTARPNWSFTVFDTGALPQFETLDAFVAEYDAFLARVGAAWAPAGA